MTTAPPQQTVAPDRRRSAVIGDLQIVGVAVAAWLGARHGRPVPIPLMVGVAVGLWFAVRARRAAVAAFALAVLVGASASWLGHRAIEPLRSAPAGPITGEATAVGDPERFGFGVRVDVSIDGLRWEAWGYGQAAARLGRAEAGDRLDIVGTRRPHDGDAPPWVLARHVAGRIDVTDVGAARGAHPAMRLANGYRGLLERGLDEAGASPHTDALARGLIVGDDRDQPDLLTADVRVTGLSHLVAVSGQNVALLLAVASPVLDRLSRRRRWAATAAILGLFALITRWEASVLRAVAMAVLVIGSRDTGRVLGRIRILALAVTGLILVDPLLIRSVGFALSVAATAGIAIGFEPIRAGLPVPRPVAAAAAATISAQLGVVAIQLATFGPPPLTAVVANLAAAPPAGAVMAWGAVVGPLAGLVGGPFAWLAHRPTILGTDAVAAAARVGAEIERSAAAVVVSAGPVLVAGLVALAAIILAIRTSRRVAALAVGALVGIAVLSTPAGPVIEPADGVRFDRRTGVLVVDGGHVVGTVAGLARAGVGTIRRIEATDERHWPVVEAVAARHRIGSIAATPVGSAADEARDR